MSKYIFIYLFIHLFFILITNQVFHLLQRIRWYCMISTPFIVFYLIGMIFQCNLDYLIKLGAFLILYIAVYVAKSLFFDERLFHILPMSLYLSTKAS